MLPNLDVFIDGGGNDCIRMEKYLKKLGSFQKVFIFEPNSIFHESYKEREYTLIKKAIWIKDCILPFHVSKDQNQVASSLLKEKLCKVNSKIQPYFYENPINVECVDFSKWIKDNIDISTNLTLKLDIEGAEYDVLWKMINDGTINYVKKLFVEFHLDTLPEKKEIQSQLINKLNELGIIYHDWD